MNSEEEIYETTEVPDKEETQEFWKSIRGADGDADWLRNFKRDFECEEEQEGVEMTPEKIQACVRYIFASLFCISKREHLRNKEKCFLFCFESSSHS